MTLKYLSLTDILSYQNNHVISRYNKDYPNNKMKGEEAFRELLKYIWLGCKHQSDIKTNPNNLSFCFNCTVHQEMSDIDDMWHTFLLFTRDYQSFCRDYLGNIFFHHEPALSKDNTSKDKYELELTRYLTYIYDHLGEETVKTWFKYAIEQ